MPLHADRGAARHRTCRRRCSTAPSASPCRRCGERLRVRREIAEAARREALRREDRRSADRELPIRRRVGDRQIEERLHQVDARGAGAVGSRERGHRCARSRGEGRAAALPRRVHAAASIERRAEAVLRIELPVVRDVGHRKHLVAAVDVVRTDRERAAVAVREARRGRIAAIRAEQAEPRLDALAHERQARGIRGDDHHFLADRRCPHPRVLGSSCPRHR